MFIVFWFCFGNEVDFWIFVFVICNDMIFIIFKNFKIICFLVIWVMKIGCFFINDENFVFLIFDGWFNCNFIFRRI